MAERYLKTVLKVIRLRNDYVAARHLCFYKDLFNRNSRHDAQENNSKVIRKGHDYLAALSKMYMTVLILSKGDECRKISN